MAEKSRTGKKGRKIGRNENKPCQKRYTSERRWEKNKLRKAEKLAKKFGCIVKTRYGEVNGN